MVTRRRMSRGVLILVLIGLIVCILVFLLVANAAGAWLVVRKFVLPTPPSRACPITSLLVDTTGFPSGTTVGKVRSPLADGPLDFTGSYQEAGRTLVVGGWGGFHHVYRARTARRAAHQYQTLKDIEFRTTPNDGPWDPPPQFGYRSSIADQYYLACGNVHGCYTCRMMAQYEEYYMLLDIPMHSGMTLADLEHVFRAIDERMAECLGKPLPSPSD